MKRLWGILAAVAFGLVVSGPYIAWIPTRVLVTEVRDNQLRQGQALTTLIGNGWVDYEYLQSVSVKVIVADGTGSGVLFSRNGRTFCWTAGHVVAKEGGGVVDDITIEQQIREGGIYKATKSIKAWVVAYSEADERQDLAILELDEFIDVSAVFAPNQVYAVGTPIVHVGSMWGFYNSVTLGIVSQTDRDLLDTGHMFDQTCAITYPGSSGGGIYLLNGQCIGIHVRGGYTGIGFMVPVRRMWAWVEKFNLRWALDPSVPLPKDMPVVLDEPEQESIPPLPDGGP